LLQADFAATVTHRAKVVRENQKKGEETEMATVQELPKVINGINVDALSATVDAVKTTPALAKFRFRVQNEWGGGSQNCSTVDSFYGTGLELLRAQPFVLRSDEPTVLLGTDAAANPVEYLLHALVACVTTSMIYHAAARGIHIEEVESSLEGDLDLQGFLGLSQSIRKGYQGIRVNFKIKADVPNEKLKDVVQLGTGYSPVFDSLTRGVPVLVSAERL
jgi:uncharacterized OsmC-like protein